MRSGLFAAGNDPDVYTFHAARELLPPELAAAIAGESALARLPGLRQRGHAPGRWRYLLPLMARYFRGLDLSSYDLVISSSHAFAAAVSPRPGAVHVCYCYTPIRYAWLPETDARRAGPSARFALRVLREYLRREDLETSSGPDAYVAISTAVRDRIRRFYGREAEVVHPPVELADFAAIGERDPRHFLWVHRLVPYKRPLEVAEAFRGLPYRLTMVGVGPLERELRRQAPPNVEIRSWLPRAELGELYGRSTGFVHAGEEDFGISMVEALAAGAPVLALDAGGARDIVRHEQDGLLIPNGRPETIRAGIRALAEREWNPHALRARAEEFSRERFLQRLADLLNALLI